MHADQPLIDKVFAELKPSNNTFEIVAIMQTWLVCLNDSPTFSKKIDDKEDQEVAVKNGVVHADLQKQD